MEKGDFQVFSTKSGGEGGVWRWALTLRGEGLTRAQAGRLAREIHSEGQGEKAVVYFRGLFRYSDVGVR